jgi:3-dehydroquinate dehydratase-2
MTAKTSLKILVLNGPNLNLLGTREPDVYGNETLADIEQLLKDRAAGLQADAGTDVTIEFRQSSSEADLIDWIGAAPGEFNGIIINPAALTHTSVGLLDAIKAVAPTESSDGVPTIEVHLSNTHSREEFRHKSLTVSGCIGQIMGFRSMSYVLALEALVNYLHKASV